MRRLKVKLCDFGLARTRAHSTRQTGVGAGTLTHMAPEVIDPDYAKDVGGDGTVGGASAASDIFRRVSAASRLA